MSTMPSIAGSQPRAGTSRYAGSFAQPLHTALAPSRPCRRCVAVRAEADGISSGKVTWIEKLPGGAAPAPPISRSDEDFEQLGVEFVYGPEGIDLSELNDLFERVNFPTREPARLQVALDNTHTTIWVRSCKQSRVARMGQLLGFARATSDGVFTATIWDVAVAPAWQRSGLGRAMMERLTRRLAEDGIPTITLYAEPKVVGLYKKLGFKSDVDGIKGMAFQRKKSAGEQQKGRR